MILESVISLLLTAGSPANGTTGVPVSVQFTPTYAPMEIPDQVGNDAESEYTMTLDGIWIPDQVGNDVNKPRQDAVHFRWNKYRYEATYLDNADAAERIRTMLEEIGYEHVDSVIVTAYASPEGVYEHNQWLAKKRAKEFENVVKKELGLDESGLNVVVRPGGEAWELLRKRIVADENVSDVARERILKLLDNDSIGWDTKKWRMEHGRLGRTRQEGDVYRWLLKNHYRYLRSLAVDIYVHGILVAIDGSMVDVVPEEPTAPADTSKTVVEEAPIAEEIVLTDEVPEAGVVIAPAPVYGPLPKLDSLLKTRIALYQEQLTKPAPKQETVADPDAFEPFDDEKTIARADSSIIDDAAPYHEKRCRPAPKQVTVGDPDVFEVYDDDKEVVKLDSVLTEQIPVDHEHVLKLAVSGEQGEAAEGEALPFWPVIGLSTNLIYDATYIPGYGFTSIPSVSLEYYPVGGHVTVGGDVEWPNWKHAGDHRFFQVHNITLWGRYYFKPEEYRFNGWYVGGSANVAQFGLGWDKKGWEGEGLGISALGGHKWTFGRIYIDMGLSLGVFYSRFDSYTWGNDATGWYYYDYVGDPEAFKPRSKRWLWLGPTRLQVSIGIDLINRNRKRSK